MMKDRYVVRIDIPGADKSNIQVSIDDRQLTVSGRINQTTETKDANLVLRQERRSGQFQRSLTLPGPVKADEMKAEYEDGVLVVSVPRSEQTYRAKRIEVL